MSKGPVKYCPKWLEVVPISIIKSYSGPYEPKRTLQFIDNFFPSYIYIPYLVGIITTDLKYM